MSQNYEVIEALALLEDLSAKSSESGLSEDTCQALFGGPCPELLQKKNNTQKQSKENSNKSNEDVIRKNHSESNEARSSERSEKPSDNDENYIKENNTSISDLKQQSLNSHVKEKYSDKLNKSKSLNIDTILSDPSKNHMKSLSDTDNTLNTLNQKKNYQDNKGNELIKDNNIDITDPLKENFDENNTIKNNIPLNKASLNSVTKPMNNYHKKSPLNDDFIKENGESKNMDVISFINIPKEHSFHKDKGKDILQETQKTELFQYVVSNHKNNLVNDKYILSDESPVSIEKTLTIANNENINTLPPKRSIGSGDYTLPLNKTQQTSTANILINGNLKKSPTTILSSGTNFTSSSGSERTYEDSEKSSTYHCSCRGKGSLCCRSQKPVVNIKCLPNINTIHHSEKMFTIKYFPPNQLSKSKKKCNKTIQTSKIILDKRIIYREIEYPNLPKTTGQGRNDKNNDIKDYTDKETFNYRGHKVPLRFPESFSNSVSPVVSSSSTDDQELFRQSSINDDCFEYLRKHLIQRGKVREVINKLENKQKLNGRCRKQTQNCSLYMSNNQVHTNNYSNSFQEDDKKYLHGIYHQCNKYY
ncbi:hypothetical protein GWI33_012346 [Rhynchophorus ferrugineus]|uniref:Uncharacterized protein n=1 Tax=Rhynchophorus ferrugineus TaxID=354439 RepID=A0A834IW77_RHYFE|nr:hypothetical protein GWI33_012346 [Rhynchophorus ferrugineus]